jgi:RNA polymerase sigma-70 factor (ECF subfamily)
MTDRTPTQPETPADRAEQFVQLFAQDRDRILAYIVTLVQRMDEAEEVFQQVSLVLWRRFGDFDPRGSFIAWARGVAHNTVRNHLRMRGRDRHVFSDELLDALAADQDAAPLEADARWAALSHCLGKLRPQDQQLVRQFYSEGLTAGALADQTQRSVPAIRKAIHKIRTALFDCIHGRMREAAE